MTVLLIDSQVAIWLLDDNPRLGPRARTLITEAARVHVSAATVWELTIKSMLGKLSVPEKLSEQFVADGLELLSVTPQHAEGLRAFPELVRHDPFDRLLVSQAQCNNLTLLTSDRVLLGLNRGFIVDATI